MAIIRHELSAWRIHSFIVLLFCTGLCTPGPVLGADDAKPFVTAKEVDLSRILPSPPASDSLQVKTELGEILKIQVTRTPEMERAAQADVEETVWRFTGVLSSKLSPASLPRFSAFFDRVVATEPAVVDPAKDGWKRPRPYQLSDLVKPAVRLSSSGSYPSGHATIGTMIGIILSNMVPEKRREIMNRAREYGWNRVIAGVHYPSDIEASRIAGSVIVQAMMASGDFNTEFEIAKAELRGQLGLPRQCDHSDREDGEDVRNRGCSLERVRDAQHHT